MEKRVPPRDIAGRIAHARSLVLINYQQTGIGATSVYYLGTNTGRRLSGPRFHRRGPVLSIVPTTTTTSNYSVYRTKTLSQQACSIRRLSAPPRRISACGWYPLPFPTRSLSLSLSLFSSLPFLFHHPASTGPADSSFAASRSFFSLSRGPLVLRDRSSSGSGADSGQRFSTLLSLSPGSRSVLSTKCTTSDQRSGEGTERKKGHSA